MENTGRKIKRTMLTGLQKTVLIIQFILLFPVVIRSLTVTVYFDPEQYIQEHVLFLWDSAVLNVVLMIGCAALIGLMSGYLSKRHNICRLEQRSVLFLALVGITWVLLTASIPAADSGYIYNAASALNRGDTETLLTDSNRFYFSAYPFQFGMVLMMQITTFLFRDYGYLVMELVNVLYMVLAYKCQYMLAEEMFGGESSRVRTVLVILNLLSIQPLLMCTFCYGIIPSYALSVAAVLCFVRWVKHSDRKQFLYSLLLITLAVIYKPNAWIPVIAFCIVIFCLMVYRKKAVYLLCILSMLMTPYLTGRAVTQYYEAAADYDFGNGLSIANWYVIGLSEGKMYDGWYNGYLRKQVKESGNDVEAINAAAEYKGGQLLEESISSPVQTLMFYYRKNVSQWCEPTYESIWISKVKEHLYDTFSIYENVYDQEDTLRSVWDIIVQSVYILFLGSLLCIIRAQKADAETDYLNALCMDVLLLVILGGFIYHSVFEAKSQYILIYYLYMLPYAAYGIVHLNNALRNGRFLKKPHTENRDL